MTAQADIIGLTVRLERTIDVPCVACGQTDVVIGVGAGPHVASLQCASCERHRGWLPKTVADFLIDVVARFGRPAEPITIHNSQFAKAKPAAPLGASRPATSDAPGN